MEGPFLPGASVDLALVRRALEAAGYNEEALAETAGHPLAGHRLDLPVLLRRTERLTPYHALVRLLLLGQPVPVRPARAALGPRALNALCEAGLLRRAGAGVRARARLTPFRGLFVAHDLGPQITRRPAADHVLGVGGATALLANLTVRRPVASALDLGTGSGTQALLASRHAARVIGTDINRRALNFAGFCARLNGAPHVELRRGSLYEPVEECRFDLIVSNPPFVISPETRYAFRDGGLPGDALSEQVVRGAGRLLQEGGYAVILFNWHHRRQQDWAERPMRWLEGSGCDAWLLRFDTFDPAEYAVNWLRETERHDTAGLARRLGRWLEYYKRAGIGWLSSGAAVLRRSRRPNWVRATTVSEPSGCAGAQVERLFAAQDLLQELGDDRKLLDETLTLAPDHQLEQVLQAGRGGWTVWAARLKQTEGLGLVRHVDALVSAVLTNCDGRRLLRALVADLARERGLRFEKIAPTVVAGVRKLLVSGFLLPNGPRQ
jgi:methylase of polypeptide subunit release factors